MKKIKIVLPACALLLCIASAWFFLDLLHYAKTANSAPVVEKVVVVSPGQSLSATTKMLVKYGLVRHPTRFNLFARLWGYDKRLRAGEYLLTSDMAPGAILDTMAQGRVHLRKVTIPEGYNLYQIGEILEKARLVGKAAFVRAATDAGKTAELGIDAESFEGYLFPETYHLPKGITPEKIVETMVKRFEAVFTPEWRKRAEELGFSVHEVVTLASIIEKETGDPSERPVISSVFYNRLKKRMRLETDPTVIYGIKDFDGNLTRQHLRTPTPYNTYKIRGLPPGPISNPGTKALEAALYPADTDYLYFVSKRDTTHAFSTNIRDHNRAVRRYQLRRR